MTKTTHTHKFKRLVYKSGNAIFFCCLPDCSTKINPALALGKRSICWRCGQEFILNEYSLRLARPHCSQCHKPKGVQAPLDEIIPYHNQVAETELWDGANPPMLDDKPLSLSERLQNIIKSAASTQLVQDEEI